MSGHYVHRPPSLRRARADPQRAFNAADMTPTDIADTLKRLHFTCGPLTIRLDKDVRDYLVAAVTRQGERSR